MLYLTRLVFQALLWGLLGLGLAIGIFVGRLCIGPVALDWMTPRIEAALTPGNGGVDVVIGGTELRWHGEHRTIELAGIDVRYGPTGGQPILTFPEVEMTLSVEALLKHGLIAVSHVAATAPSLMLTRNEDGIIGLQSDEGDGDGVSNIDFGAFLRHVALAPTTDERISYLKHLRISGGDLTYIDEIRGETIEAKTADLVLDRQEDGVHGWLRAVVVQDSAQLPVQVSGHLDHRSERILFEADIADFLPAQLPALLPIDFGEWAKDLGGIQLPVRTSIKGDVGLDGTLSPLHFDLQTSKGVVTLPNVLTAPLDVTSSKLDVVLSPDFSAIDINDLRLTSGEATLSAKGRLSWRDGQIDTLVNLAATNVRAEDLATYWPPSLGSDARPWVIENITTGLVSQAEATIELRPDDFGPAPLRDDAVLGSFAFSDVSVRYVDTMPPLEGASGEATFNADRMDFTVDGGDSAGVQLDGGTVTITGMDQPGKLATQLNVLADARGSIERAMALLDHPPLDVAKDLEIAPEQMSGEVTTKLDIRMPLHDDVTDDEVEVRAEAVLANAGIDGLPRVGDEVLLTNGTFDLRVETDVVHLDGSAEVSGVPLLIKIQEPLIEDAVKRRFHLKGQLTRADLEKTGLVVDGLDGEIDFGATVTETDEQFWIDLDADLTSLAVAPPGLAWTKKAGSGGTLLASIAVPDDGAIDIKRFELTAGDLKAAGRLKLARADYEISSLAIDEFRLGETNAALRLDASDEYGRNIAIEAETLDLDALRSEATSNGTEEHADADPFHLVLQAGRLRLKGLDLLEVQADAIRKTDGWQSASLLAGLASGDKIALELTPDGAVRQLDFRSDNAGALIEALDFGQRLRGGDLQLAATLASQTPIIAEGRLQMERFTLKDAPLLARLLTVASLTGIGNLLEGEGILVDQLSLPFAINDQKLTITDGLLRGSQLGLTVKGAIDLEEDTLDLAGTIIPVYTLNRLIGQVPIIGQILTGSEGRGAFAATYQIKGPRSRPKVYVNPLSILTPGLVRDLFNGVSGLKVDDPNGRETEN